MTGCLTVCLEHHAVYNAVCEVWQDLSQEMMDELLAVAEEMDAKVFDGCCERCLLTATTVFHALYQARYAESAYQEMGSDIILPPLQGLDPSME